jgi:cobalt-zinc-cadmium efflux system membrane fusion protein
LPFFAGVVQSRTQVVTVRRPNAILVVLSYVTVFIGGWLTACGHEAQPAQAAQDRAAPAMTRDHGRIVVPEGSPLRERLTIEQLEARPVRRALEVPAHVEADPSRVARITPPLPGRIVSLAVHFGDEVHAGDTLLSIDSPELAEAQRDHLDAEAALAQAERNLTRAQDLYDHHILARADLENAQTQRQIAAAELERTASRLRLLGVRGGGAIGRSLTVRAPITGRVVELQVSVGEFHSDLSVPLMTIADLSTVWISASVQERDLSRVSVGMQVTAVLAAYPDAPVSGSVLYVGDLLDPETRTLPVRIAFDNPDHRLHPGMFANVTFEETARPEIVVPQPAVVLRGDHNVVFVEVPNQPWTFEEREVTLGPASGDDLVVTQHLSPGDRVVVAQAILLQ